MEAVAGFVGEAVWTKYGIERRRRATGGFRAPDRVSQTRIDCFRDIAGAQAEDPAGANAQALVARWNALLDRETAGDPELKSQTTAAWARRKDWPIGMQRYVASLYAMDYDTWEKVTAFIDTVKSSK